MPILKIYDISSVDEVKKIYQETEQVREYKKYDEYSKDNIMLIRTTEIFPTGGIIRPLSLASHIERTGSNFIYQAMYYEMSNDQLNHLKTYELYYRSTIHFTENGLVSSHMYGNFDNQTFIIMDSLNEHVGKSNIRNFAGQDTFVDGCVNLSDKSIIIIKQEQYDEIKKIYPEIDNFNLVLYKGIPDNIKEEYLKNGSDNIPEFDVNDKRAVVERTLMDLGYVPELIGSHYIINSPTSDKIVLINKDLGEQYGVLANSKHNYSEEYKKDFEKNMKITEIFNKLLLEFIIKFNDINSDMININERINNNMAYKLINILGFDNLIQTIEVFNNTILKMKQLGMMPTSEDFINGNIPSIFESYSMFDNLENNQIKI